MAKDEDNTTLLLAVGGLAFWWFFLRQPAGATTPAPTGAGAVVPGVVIAPASSPGVVVAPPLSGSCPAGQIWDETAGVCRDRRYLGPPVQAPSPCLAGYVWDGKQCVPQQSDPPYYYPEVKRDFTNPNLLPWIGLEP